MQLLTGKWVSNAVSAVARFAIPDLLESGPKTIDELAAATSTNKDALYRLLRATSCVGVCTELEDGRFAQTPLSEVLRTNAKPGLRNMAMMLADEWNMNFWGALPWSVQTGKSASFKVFGKPPWEAMMDLGEQSERFHNAMTDMSQMDSPVVAASYDFSQFKKIVDVAGGMGTLLAAILGSAPSLHGVLYEIPQAVEQAKGIGILRPFESRCEIIAGSMLESVPAGADAFIMKHIIHDWDDEHSVQILSNCRKAVAPGGKVLVVDTVIPGGNQFSFGKFLDLEMLVAPGGKERTAPEWEVLFTKAGLKLNRIIDTPAGMAILEGVSA